MKVEIKGGKLLIEMDINKPLKLSKSEKSYVLCTTNGNKPTTVQHEGKVVTLGLTAYISKD